MEAEIRASIRVPGHLPCAESRRLRTAWPAGACPCRHCLCVPASLPAAPAHGGVRQV